MEPITDIPLWRTLVNWCAVVVGGSFIAPALLGSFHPGLIAIFMLFSAVFSLPALLLFILVNWEMNKQKLPVSRYRRKQALIHFGASLLTFLVIGTADDFSDPELLMIAATYTGLGQLAWWITFYSRHTQVRVAPNINNHQNLNV